MLKNVEMIRIISIVVYEGLMGKEENSYINN